MPFLGIPVVSLFRCLRRGMLFPSGIEGAMYQEGRIRQGGFHQDRGRAVAGALPGVGRSMGPGRGLPHADGVGQRGGVGVGSGS